MAGKLAKLLSFVRTSRNGAVVSEAKVDPGGGLNLTLEHFSTPGDDSHPLPGDYVAALPTPSAGRGIAVGYADPLNAQTAGAGERRLYARDAAGAAIVELHLLADGSATLFNALGSITLEAGGNVVINGATIDTDGNISSPTSVSAPSIVADSKELTDHDHPITSGSSSPGPTGPNNA